MLIGPRQACLVVMLVLSLAFSLSATAAESPQAINWPQRTAAAIAQLGAGLDLAATNPSAAKPILAEVLPALSAIIDAAPCSRTDLAKLRFNRGLLHAALGDHAAALLDFKASDSLRPTAVARARVELERSNLHVSSAPQSPATPAGSAAKPATASQPLSEQASRLVRRVAPDVRWNLTLALVATFWLLLGLRLTGPRPLRRAGVMLGAAASLVLAGLGLGSLLIDRGSSREVVVLAADCTPRAGPDTVAYPPATFDGGQTIPRGSELIVLDARDLAAAPGKAAWLKVRRAAGESLESPSAGVWIPAECVGWVDPRSSRAAP